MLDNSLRYLNEARSQVGREHLRLADEELLRLRMGSARIDSPPAGDSTADGGRNDNNAGTGGPSAIPEPAPIAECWQPLLQEALTLPRPSNEEFINALRGNFELPSWTYEQQATEDAEAGGSRDTEDAEDIEAAGAIDAQQTNRADLNVTAQMEGGEATGEYRLDLDGSDSSAQETESDDAGQYTPWAAMAMQKYRSARTGQSKRLQRRSLGREDDKLAR